MSKLNKAVIIVTVTLMLFLVVINTLVFNLANDFKEKHNAVEYEKTYIQPRTMSDGVGVALSSPVEIRLLFLDAEGIPIPMDFNTTNEYYDLNKTVQNYVETWDFLAALFLVLSILSLIMSLKDRYNISGLIILTLLSLVLISNEPLYGIYMIPILIIAGIGAFLTYKSRFVDWNQSLFLTFNKN